MSQLSLKCYSLWNSKNIFLSIIGLLFILIAIFNIKYFSPPKPRKISYHISHKTITSTSIDEWLMPKNIYRHLQTISRNMPSHCIIHTMSGTLKLLSIELYCTNYNDIIPWVETLNNQLPFQEKCHLRQLERQKYWKFYLDISTQQNITVKKTYPMHHLLKYIYKNHFLINQWRISKEKNYMDGEIIYTNFLSLLKDLSANLPQLQFSHWQITSSANHLLKFSGELL